MNVTVVRPPRVLVASPMSLERATSFQRWEATLRDQETSLLWDVLLVDGTSGEHDAYVEMMRTWARSRPFGVHRVRLKRFGDVEGRHFASSDDSRQYAQSVIFEAFNAATSYDHLMLFEVGAHMPSHGMQVLYEAGEPWVARGTGLRCAFLRGEMVRQVPFTMTSLGGDAGYQLACEQSGFRPVQVGQPRKRGTMTPVNGR